jgi:hypothetical protein
LPADLDLKQGRKNGHPAEFSHGRALCMKVSLIYTERNRDSEDLQACEAIEFSSPLDANGRIAHRPHEAIAALRANGNGTWCFSSLELKEERAGRLGGIGRHRGAHSGAR